VGGGGVCGWWGGVQSGDERASLEELFGWDISRGLSSKKIRIPLSLQYKKSRSAPTGRKKVRKIQPEDFWEYSESDTCEVLRKEGGEGAIRSCSKTILRKDCVKERKILRDLDTKARTSHLSKGSAYETDIRRATVAT